jgi:hypothetical protein
MVPKPTNASTSAAGTAAVPPNATGPFDPVFVHDAKAAVQDVDAVFVVSNKVKFGLTTTTLKLVALVALPPFVRDSLSGTSTVTLLVVSLVRMNWTPVSVPRLGSNMSNDTASVLLSLVGPIVKVWVPVTDPAYVVSTPPINSVTPASAASAILSS